jgi:hypothetical protein
MKYPPAQPPVIAVVHKCKVAVMSVPCKILGLSPEREDVYPRVDGRHGRMIGIDLRPLLEEVVCDRK